MELINEVNKTIIYTIKWIGTTVEATIEWGLAEPSEGAIIVVALFLIGYILRKVRHR